MDFENDVRIDESSLDVMWLDQPRLVMKYAKASAQARKEMDKAKERLEVVKAELDRGIRSDPDKYGVSKITEGVVASTVLLQSEYQKAMEEYIESKYEQNLTQEALRAVSDRKDSLENLVRLLGMNYFSGPSVPRDLSKEWEANQKQKRADTAITIKRKREKGE